jgi:hypothetical protein
MRVFFQTKIIEKITTCSSCSIIFFVRALYEIIWKNIIEPDRQQMTVWGMCIACWIPQATNTHTEYIIFIAFPLHECPSMLLYMCIASLVTCTVIIPLLISCLPLSPLL